MESRRKEQRVLGARDKVEEGRVPDTRRLARYRHTVRCCHSLNMVGRRVIDFKTYTDR